MNPSLAQGFVTRTKNLPPAPVVMLKLMEQCGREDRSVEEIASTIEKDPGLTASLLRLCNSAALGGSEPVSTVEEAAFRLGFRQIHRQAMILCAQKVIQNPRGQARENRLWEHSLAVALAAKQIGILTGIDELELFTTGLLHDIGKLVIVLNAGVSRYESVFALASSRRCPLYQAETEFFGVSHTEVGGCLLDRWNIPATIRAGVTLHHAPLTQIVGTTSVVLLANRIAQGAKQSCGNPLYAEEEVETALEQLGLASDAMEHLIEETAAELAQEKSKLEVCAGLRLG